MMDFRELSRLPEDPGYWTRLENRIVGELRPTLHAVAEARSGWWTPLAERAWSLGTLAAAASLAALLVLPPRPAERQPSLAVLLGLSEDDPALAALLTDSEPPELASMLLTRWRTAGR